MGREEHFFCCARKAVIFRPFYYYDWAALRTSSVAARVGRCAVVDPRADDVETTSSSRATRRCSITQVIDTHVHADHRSGGVALAQGNGSAVPPARDRRRARSVHTHARRRAKSTWGTRASVCCTRQGTRPRACALVVTDLKRGTDPWFVLTGDTLFVGAVGRPDLPGQARENAERLYASIHDRLLVSARRPRGLPGAFLRIACGAGLSGKPSSTIAFERRWNPMLSLHREAFVAALVGRAAEAAEMERILAANRGRFQLETTA